MVIPNEHDYHLTSIGPCLRLVEAEELLPVLQQAMPGWPIERCSALPEAPEICVWQHPDGYWQEAPALPQGALLDTDVGTACSVVADLAGAFLHRHPELVGLHCGSVELNGQLVIFPDAHRAGKSTLTAAFSAAGCRVFGDDVLALNLEGEGIALGVAPRLRLPVPEALSVDFQHFVACHLGPFDDRYGYLNLSSSQLAAHGDRSPLGAVLLIDRDPTLTAPQLTRLNPGDGLWQLLQQNFAEHESDQALMDRFLPLLQRLPCFLLRYSDAYEAALWLAKRWEGQPFSADRQQGQAVARDERAAVPALLLDGTRCWHTSPAAFEWLLGDELFVIGQNGGDIHRMNATSRAVWALLQHEPMNLQELSETLVAFSEGASLPQVTRDVAQLLANLAKAGLLHSVEAEVDKAAE
ncbi:PqqD family protein [Vreelandella stevensii]|uniref:PqqD family protein n=1 Tax=Vreelandella stevensii TaxID=502821 RepID=UPI00403AB9F9